MEFTQEEIKRLAEQSYTMKITESREITNVEEAVEIIKWEREEPAIRRVSVTSDFFEDMCNRILKLENPEKETS